MGPAVKRRVKHSGRWLMRKARGTDESLRRNNERRRQRDRVCLDVVCFFQGVVSSSILKKLTSSASFGDSASLRPLPDVDARQSM